MQSIQGRNDETYVWKTVKDYQIVRKMLSSLFAFYIMLVFCSHTKCFTII